MSNSESTATTPPGEWKPTACILCENNCGIEVQLGGEASRKFEKIRGDRAHPGTEGYLCQKASRLDYYQNGRDRLLAPMRRRPDGEYEEIDWDTAIREVAERFAEVRDRVGGDKIFYYGGAGQGNHLPAAYAGSTLTAIGSIFRSNALAQEKTGEFWVNGRMFGAPVRGDFERCEVALFVGKNPWQSHGVPRARVTLQQIARDPARKMIVVDPRRSETAELADYHLQLRPGTDAWLFAALIGILVQEGLAKREWLADHTEGSDAVLGLFAEVPVARYCEVAGISEEVVREVAGVIAGASSVAAYEDLGIQMNRHSTLVSYLEKLVWVLTGHFGVEGAQNVLTLFRPLAVYSERPPAVSPVTGARVISGLVPCNSIADEILTDHPDRFRAMLIESSNPAHSLADSQRMRQALEALDFVVVIDVAMTETARLADYVLPVPTQYEKWEATFFNLDFPENHFQLRRPLLEPPAELLTEPEIHARLVEALGAMPTELIDRLNDALDQDPMRFAALFQAEVAGDPEMRWFAPVILLRTLGTRLPGDAASAATLWSAAHQCAERNGDSLRQAGFRGSVPEIGEALFQKILSSPSGFRFAVDVASDSWKKLRHGGKIQVAVPELLERLEALSDEPALQSEEFPLILSAGERRSYTANTIYRDPHWRKVSMESALRLCAEDADRLRLATGDTALLSTKRGAARVVVEISDRMQPGHVSLPNGTGLTSVEETPDGVVVSGIAPNELTATEDCDEFAGTPWHKSVPARLEAI